VLKAIVFDFDGVLANSEPLHYLAFRDVLAEQGVSLSESDYYAKYLGYDDVGALAAVARDQRRVFPAAVIKSLVARKAVRMEELEREKAVLFPGAAEAVVRLAGSCPLAIASGALRAEITRILDRERLSIHFAAIVGAEDTAVSKPAPDPYHRAVQLLSSATGSTLSPAECVAIEDSQWGIESARAAGLRTVAITHTYPAEALAAADKIVSGLDVLTWELLRSLVEAPGPGQS
jgi:HAD superfamily hydrolase (TIGR01509 family)